MHVQVEDVGLLDPGVHQLDPAGITSVGPQDGRDRLPEQPRAVVLLLPRDLLEVVAVQVLGDAEDLPQRVVELDADRGVVDPVRVPAG